MTLELAFDATVVAPGVGERIVLPLVGVQGRVMEGVEVSWEGGLSIPVSSWDALEDAALYKVNPVTQEFTLMDLDTPVLAATAGSGSIALNWEDIEDAASYVVQVSSDAGTTRTNQATPSTSTYTHTGLTTGQTRHYRVRAVHATLGNGPWSNTTTATATA